MEQNYLTEEQRLVRRRRSQKAKQRRAVITGILLMMIIFISLVAAIFAYMYGSEQKKTKTALAERDAAVNEYNSLMNDLNQGGYITRDAADAMVDEAVTSNSEDILAKVRGYLENGDGTLVMLENMYPANIVVPDIDRYHFFEVDETLNKHGLNLDAFTYPVKNEETGDYEGEAYYDDGTIKARKGVDVSKFQGNIDWNKVKNDGFDFAIIRLGYRGYESGKIVTDEKFEDNIAGCNEAGIDCSVYFFTEAKNAAEGKEEAEYVLENLEGYHVELPIVIDVEQSANVNASRTKNVTKDERTDAVIAFCERIKQAGYTPMIYGNLKSMMLMTDITRLEEYDKWFAYYHFPLRFPYKFRIWQYSDTGKVDGIKGDADLNLMFY